MARNPKPMARRSMDTRRDTSRPAGHPINNEKNHQALLKHIVDRLLFSKSIRQGFIDKINAIDIDYAGAQQYNEDDKKRDKDNKQGKGLKAITVNIQFTQMQIDEAVTFLMSVFAPDSGFFKAMTEAEKQPIANALAAAMTMDAEKQGYYRQYMKFDTDALKYNLACMYIYWDEINGNVMKADPSGTEISTTREVIWQGNCIEALDMYNVYWDPTVSPIDVNMKGEYFAFCKRYNKFAIEKMQDDEIIYGIDRFRTDQTTGREQNFFTEQPQIARPTSSNTKGSAMDWVDVFSAGVQAGVAPGTEITNYIGWIIPKDFGLSGSTKREIWRISVANGRYICGDERLDYAHNMLPCAFGQPLEDNMRTSDRSYAEILLPLQIFASTLINIHILGARKGLYGLTVYDPHVVPLNDQEVGVSAMIPVRSSGYDKDVRKSIIHMNTGPDTARTMQDVGGVLELMQKILPTDMAKMVTDLDRATTYQAAATVQGANRRNLKIARTLDDQAFKNIRYMMVCNIQQKQKIIKVRMPDGTRQDFNPRQTIGLDLSFDINDGLKAIDRMMYLNQLKELILAMIQNPNPSQPTDLGKLLNYWSEMMGDKFDLSQFNKSQEQMLREEMMRNPKLAEQMAAQGGIPNGAGAAGPTNGTGQPPPVPSNGAY